MSPTKTLGPCTEANESFTIGPHQYEIRMCFEGEHGKWYEVWDNGAIVGDREEWPLGDHHELMTQKAFLRYKEGYLTEQHRRKKEVGWE